MIFLFLFRIQTTLRKETSFTRSTMNKKKRMQSTKLNSKWKSKIFVMSMFKIN